MTRITQKLQNFIEEKWLSRLTPLLESKESERMFNELTKEKLAGKLIYPPQKDIFNAFKYTPWDDVKVVILGQD